jgi:hypothetical protein
VRRKMEAVVEPEICHELLCLILRELVGDGHIRSLGTLYPFYGGLCKVT